MWSKDTLHASQNVDDGDAMITMWVAVFWRAFSFLLLARHCVSRPLDASERVALHSQFDHKGNSLPSERTRETVHYTKFDGLVDHEEHRKKVSTQVEEAKVVKRPGHLGVLELSIAFKGNLQPLRKFIANEYTGLLSSLLDVDSRSIYVKHIKEIPTSQGRSRKGFETPERTLVIETEVFLKSIGSALKKLPSADFKSSDRLEKELVKNGYDVYHDRGLFEARVVIRRVDNLAQYFVSLEKDVPDLPSPISGKGAVARTKFTSRYFLGVIGMFFAIAVVMVNFCADIRKRELLADARTILPRDRS
ncbi:hypothetical protein BSKO_08971 [Bryopsis sp. KO-2023]|nr:hypothetical protein BSKO_08971 [Bryopsis sp. KO-2023]